MELTASEFLLALCIWREARGERHAGKLGVKHVVLNRAAAFPRWPATIKGVVWQRYQFSSFNANDRNARLWPDDADVAWQECIDVVKSTESDPTGGAVFYFSPPITAAPPQWGAVVQTTTIGRLHFYKLETIA